LIAANGKSVCEGAAFGNVLLHFRFIVEQYLLFNLVLQPLFYKRNVGRSGV
jgi:hypothetical protein